MTNAEFQTAQVGILSDAAHAQTWKNFCEGGGQWGTCMSSFNKIGAALRSFGTPDQSRMHTMCHTVEASQKIPPTIITW